MQKIFKKSEGFLVRMLGRVEMVGLVQVGFVLNAELRCHTNAYSKEEETRRHLN